jgi:two-component system OmpR family response regulator
MTKILVVEDDELVSESVIDMLKSEHFTVEAVADGLDAWYRLEALQYDLVILDWNLPSMEGVEVLTKLRGKGNSTPVLMLTANSGVDSRIEGLDSGADDYLAKPFSMRELLSRVRALLRRPQEYKGETVQADDIVLNISEFKCFRAGEEIKLHPKEFALLEHLIRNKGRVFSVDELLERLWSCDSDSSVEAARKCITRLRQKIDVPGKASYVTTVVGRGYKID